MAGTEVKDVLLRLRADASQAKSELKGASDGVNLLGDSAKLAGLGVAGLGAVVAATIKAIDRGQGVTELSNAFTALNSKAGGSVEALTKLREATQGLLTDTDLMRASNQALLAGLSPDQFLKVASAADALGDAFGLGTKESMDQLVNALATGNDRLLKQFGILIDNKKAEEDFAKSIGVTADKLNEAGKREASRIAILAEMERKTKDLGESNMTAGDALQRTRNLLSNMLDEFSRGVNESQGLAYEINRVADALANLSGKADPLKMELKAVAEEMRALKEAAGRDLSTVPLQLRAQFERGAAAADMKTEGVKNYQEFLEALVESRTEWTAAIEKMTSFGQATRKTDEDVKKYTQTLKDGKKQFAETLGDLTDPLSFVKINAGGFGDVFGSLGTFYGDEAAKAAQAFYDETDDAIKEAAKKLEEENKEAFKNSVGFFEDILTTTITGSSQSLEEILTDALKRVAIGFGAQLLAEVAASMGLTSTVGGLGSASGLGQSLASALFGGGGLGSLFGGANIGPVADGGAYAASLASTATSLTSIAATLVPVAAVAGGVLAGYTAFNRFQSSNQSTGDAASAGAQTYLAGDVTGFSQLYFLAASQFGIGGDPKLAAERKARNSALRDIQERMGGSLSFQGVRGTSTLNAGNYNIDTSGLGGDAVGLANPLAQILTGGDDKLGSDLAAIFANATKEGSNFNEVLLNTQALMGKLGINAEEAKNELANLFLDGKVQLDEFSAGIANLNLLAQNDLVGPESVSDAFRVLAENIENNPRLALKGLELAFKEMKDAGIDTTAEISAYLMDRFGPDVVEVFEQLAASGIQSFEDIQNASADELVSIFNLITGIADDIQSAFSETGQTMGESIERGAKRAKEALNGIGTDAERTTRVLNSLTRANKSLGVDDNRSLARNPR